MRGQHMPMHQRRGGHPHGGLHRARSRHVRIMQRWLPLGKFNMHGERMYLRQWCGGSGFAVPFARAGAMHELRCWVPLSRDSVRPELLYVPEWAACRSWLPLHYPRSAKLYIMLSRVLCPGTILGTYLRIYTVQRKHVLMSEWELRKRSKLPLEWRYKLPRL